MSTAVQTCPPLEEIAALLDGRLSGVERDRVMAHLADCEDCYEIFAGAARFQLDEERETGETGPSAEAAEVVPFPRKRLLPWIGSLAAVLLVGLAAIPLYRAYTEVPPMVSAEIVDPSIQAEDVLWTEGTLRSGNLQSDAYTAAQVLVGVHLVDLRLTLAWNAPEREVSDALARVNQHMDNVLVKPPEADFYLAALRRIGDGLPPRELLDEADRAEAGLRESLGPDYLDLGKWAEAGRISAVTRSPAFFQDRENRRFLRSLLRRSEELYLEEPVVRALEQIRDLLDEAEAPALPYEALAARFRDILLHYQREVQAGSGF